MVMDAGLDSTGPDKDGWDNTDEGGAGFNARARAGPFDAHARGGPFDAHACGGPALPDARKLAQDWITLWQSELAAMAADPEIQEAWQTIVALWAGSMATLVRGLPRAEGPGRWDGAARHGRGYDAAPRSAGATDAPRAATAAAAPDPRDAEIERLARHVAALERRLGELERGGDPAVDPGVRPELGAAGRQQRK